LILEKSGTERRGYPPKFRSKVVDLVEAGRSVADVARDLGISDQPIYTWRRQTGSTAAWCPA
jgi:transposase-like protein